MTVQNKDRCVECENTVPLWENRKCDVRDEMFEGQHHESKTRWKRSGDITTEDHQIIYAG